MVARQLKKTKNKRKSNPQVGDYELIVESVSPSKEYQGQWKGRFRWKGKGRGGSFEATYQREGYGKGLFNASLLSFSGESRGKKSPTPKEVTMAAKRVLKGDFK